MKFAYYNEFDKDKAAWLRELVKAGLIAPGDVDDRSIADINASDLMGYTQCHFFSGIGVWSYALRLAGWGDDRQVWTEAAPAHLSALQVKGEGLQTLVTSGRYGSTSSESATLEQSLVSKLMARLDTAGSTLYQETWKRRATPLRRRYWAHTARVLRTSDSDCTSVPSPCTPNGGRSMSTEKMDATGRTLDGRKHAASLEHAVKFATVTTPQARDENRSCCSAAALERERNREGRSNSLALNAALASISTPSARDWKDSSGMSESGVDPDGSIRSRLDQLPRQAQLAASGLTAIGGTDATESTDQLDPEYSRWLMGLPPEWSSCAVTAMQSVAKRRRTS